MSSEVTNRLVKPYIEKSPRSAFLASTFQSPAENMFNTEKVEFDVVRGEEDVAIVVTDLSAGSRSNTSSLYTNKSFTPPIYSEDFSINAFDLIKREAGSNPFEDPNFQLNASRRFLTEMHRVQAKILRSIELQASQIYTTGKLVLTDAANVALYELDFKPKASHFPTAGTPWTTAGAPIISDLNSLCNQVRDDGMELPDTVYMGEASFEAMISDADIQKRLDNRRIDTGDIVKNGMVRNGGTYKGELKVGNYTLQVWTYPGRYKDPVSGTKKQYLAGNKVVIRSEAGRMDAFFGAIPMIVPPSQRALPFIPGTLNMEGKGISLNTNAWVSPNGSQLMGSAGARPLLVPTAIDTFGCLDTGI